jgi:nucleotide-binding universal stress UspA family protein
MITPSHMEAQIMFTSILVAVDGSDHARQALQTAGGLAALTGASLTVVTIPQLVVDPVLVGYTTVPVPVSREDQQREGEATLSAAMTALPEGQRKAAHTGVLFGDPAHAIVEQATAIKADLIVLGRRGLGRLQGLLIGSTSAKVGQLAPCAVLTVK